MNKLLAKATVTGVAFLIFMKIGAFNIRAEGLLEQLLTCMLLSVLFIVAGKIMTWLFSALSIASCGLLIPILILIPVATFDVMQRWILPGEFHVTTSGFLQIVIGIILWIIWGATN